jgi:hypothetical protein
MKLPDAPSGWLCLQALAERAPDADNLALIIEKMNRILDAHEAIVGSRNPMPSVRRPEPDVRVETQCLDAGE